MKTTLYLIICRSVFQCKRKWRNVETAYKFGVNAIQLEGIREELTPTIRKKPNLNTNDSNSTIEVFFSYASEDEKLRIQLEKHLSILKRQEVIKGWHHRKIRDI
ncbi:MAG: hypothetical protein AAFY76_08995 [Cyanobacteria bacterium J06649_11]